MNISPIYCPDSGCFWSAHGIPDQYTEARDWHLAAHRAEEHGEPLTEEQIVYATRAGHVIPGTARTTAAAVAALGALPVPVGDEPQPLDDTRLAEIHLRDLTATKGPWGIYESGSMIDIAADLQETGCGYRARREIARFEDEPLDSDPTHKEWTAEEDWEQVRIDAEFVAHAREDIPALLADNARLRAEVAELKDQRERRRARLVALQNDALSMRGSLAPADGPRAVPFELGETLTPAVDWLIARVAELEKRDDWLSALEAAGVDNWEGYDEALEIAGEAS